MKLRRSYWRSRCYRPTCAEAEKMEWNEEKITKYWENAKKEGSNIKMTLPEEEKRKMESRTVIFRTFLNENRRIEHAPQEEIEEMVVVNMGEKITFFTRRRRYGTIVVTFLSEDEVRKSGNMMLTGVKWTLMLNCWGQKNCQGQGRKNLTVDRPRMGNSRNV
uniref:Uncharacterized protein n=1 Tax=Octopus bimaculoides TaxID=37653 RepID=A0A0L8FJ98_OCTBM